MTEQFQAVSLCLRASVRSNTVLATGIVVACLVAGSLRAENWPGWRGPGGDGTSTETEFPQIWDLATGENITWSVDVQGDGHSSPVIWDDRIYLTTCLPDSLERVLLALDRGTGETIWRRTVTECPLESIHKLNSRASATPVTDGKNIYVAFLEVDGSTIPAPNVGTPRPITPGKILVASYDADGNRNWVRRVGEFISAHGFCSCPVLVDDIVIINGDHDGNSYILALDQATGETVWRQTRPHGIRSYVTPIIREIDGERQMVLSGSQHIAALRPTDGTTIWSIEGPTEQFVASMVFDGERFFMAAGFPDYHVMAIDPTGRGDVTDSHVVWHSETARCYVPSPVVTGGYLIVANDEGIVHCFDAETGELAWRSRLGRHYSASLVTAGGLVYLTDDDGITKIFRPGPELDIVAENALDADFTCSSPALSDGQIFIRTEHRLHCIGERRTESIRAAVR